MALLSSVALGVADAQERAVVLDPAAGARAASLGVVRFAYRLLRQPEELHVSVWPGNPRNSADISRFIALEGRVFSLAVNGLISLSDVPTDFPLHAELQEAGVTDYCRGGSGIAVPDGTWIAPPVVGQDRLVIADLDLRRVSEEGQNFDPRGH